MMQREFFDSLIAKTSVGGTSMWLPLRVHMEDSFEVSYLLWERWLSKDVKRRLAEECGGYDTAQSVLGLVALLHDAGKATPDFQTKIVAGMALIKRL